MGLGRVELPTSPLSGVRSSHLSYRPGILQPTSGGAGRDRTGDLLRAKQALSQLSYSPRKSSEADWTQGPRRPASRPLTKTPELLQRFPERDPRSCDRGLEWNGCQRASPAAACCCARRGFSLTPPTFSLRKEVIQPQVLLRLPCYDFTPIMNHTLGRCSLAVSVRTSSTIHFRDVTGGVYKARERIHRGVLIRDY